jgi:hypothetical protein
MTNDAIALALGGRTDITRTGPVGPKEKQS